MASKPQLTVNARCPECPRVLRTLQGLRRHLRTVHGTVLTDRQCTRCGEVKDVGCFGLTGIDGNGVPRYRSSCDDCRVTERASRNERRRNRPESHKRRDRKKAAAQRFGLTLEAWEQARADFLEAQGGVCAICQKRPPIHLDHCHATGRLRGFLCRKCNLGLGYIDDDPAVAERMAVYLKREGG